LTTRGQFFATGAVVAAGAASLSSCSAERDPYAIAARRTWRPFDEAITERRALQHELIRYATLAPSSRNTQCWIELRRDRIAIEPDWSRRCPAVDPDDHHLFVSLGCATENLIQAARAHGFRSEARFDAAGGGTVTIALESARPTLRYCSKQSRSGTARERCFGRRRRHHRARRRVGDRDRTERFRHTGTSRRRRIGIPVLHAVPRRGPPHHGRAGGLRGIRRTDESEPKDARRRYPRRVDGLAERELAERERSRRHPTPTGTERRLATAKTEGCSNSS